MRSADTFDQHRHVKTWLHPKDHRPWLVTRSACYTMHYGARQRSRLQLSPGGDSFLIGSSGGHESCVQPTNQNTTISRIGSLGALIPKGTHCLLTSVSWRAWVAHRLSTPGKKVLRTRAGLAATQGCHVLVPTSQRCPKKHRRHRARDASCQCLSCGCPLLLVASSKLS